MGNRREVASFNFNIVQRKEKDGQRQMANGNREKRGLGLGWSLAEGSWRAVGGGFSKALVLVERIADSFRSAAHEQLFVLRHPQLTRTAALLHWLARKSCNIKCCIVVWDLNFERIYNVPIYYTSVGCSYNV